MADIDLAARAAQERARRMATRIPTPQDRASEILTHNNPSLKTLAQSRLEGAPISRNQMQADETYCDPISGRPYPGGKEQAERVAAARKAAGRPTSQPRNPVTGEFESPNKPDAA